MSDSRGALIGDNGAYDNMSGRMGNGDVVWKRLDMQSPGVTRPCWPPCLETLGEGGYEELPGTILRGIVREQGVRERSECVPAAHAAAERAFRSPSDDLCLVLPRG